MNFAALSLLAIAIFAAVFATDAGTTALAGTPVALFSVFSIFAAAVLVRLNRGLPSVEWKLVDKDSLCDLLDAVEAISKDYIWGLSIILAGIVATVGYSFLAMMYLFGV